MFRNKDTKNAILIGSLCTAAYVFTYLSRSILSALSPQLVESGVFDTEYIATLSSVFFFSYAIGQLVNGIIGDRILARNMVLGGLGLAGICSILFPRLAAMRVLLCILYGAMGFLLSMVFSPMAKLIAENTTPVYATRCDLGLEVAAMLGAPFAGAIAIFMVFRTAFTAVGAAMIAVAVLFFLCVRVFEKKGIVSYNQYRHPKEKNGVRVLIENRIIRFTVIAALTGIVRTSVVFWLPLYMSRHLGFTPEAAAGIFTAATLVISLSAFFSVFAYEKLGYNMDLTIFLGFLLSACSFAGVFLVRATTANIVLMISAIFFSNCASEMMWTRYCPSLRDTGMVATASGYLDFISYMAASLANILFADAAESIGWGNLILVWGAMMVFGTVISIPRKVNRASAPQ